MSRRRDVNGSLLGLNVGEYPSEPPASHKCALSDTSHRRIHLVFELQSLNSSCSDECNVLLSHVPHLHSPCEWLLKERVLIHLKVMLERFERPVEMETAHVALLNIHQKKK